MRKSNICLIVVPKKELKGQEQSEAENPPELKKARNPQVEVHGVPNRIEKNLPEQKGCRTE